MLSATTDKQQQFKAAMLNNIVYKNLKKLKTLVDGYADELLAHSPEETKQGGQDAISQIDQDFENALAQFS